MVAPKLALGVALLACAGQADAMKWALSETYDSTNFLSKFNFFEVNGSPAYALATLNTKRANPLGM